MDALFGEDTTAVPTPATLAERGSLMGVGSPGSLDIRQGNGHPSGMDGYGADAAIPGLDIDPPEVEVGQGGKPVYTSGDGNRGSGGAVMTEGGERGEGISGWIGRMVSRTRREGQGTMGGEGYGRVEQDDD
jgi:hypothetical protein